MVHLKSNFNYIHFSKVKIKQELTLGRQLLLWTVVVMDSCCYGQLLLLWTVFECSREVESNTRGPGFECRRHQFL